MKKIIPFYHSLNKSHIYDGRDFNNMYMTSFIQLIINSLSKVKADIINGGWLEFDNQKDLIKYKSNSNFI